MGFKCKHAGFPICATRLSLAAWIVMAGTMGFTGPILIALYALGLFTVCGISGAKHGKTSVNGRELTPKEAKRCCKRFYIYFVVVLATALWIIALLTYEEEISYVIDLTILVPILSVLAIVDMFYVKPKYFKYTCVSYLEDD